MVDAILTAIAIAAFFAILFFGAAHTRVAYISKHAIDGDTVRAFWRGRWVSVRIRGIDAPEMAQEGGKAAKEYIERTICGQWVVLEKPASDKWGRVLADLVSGPVSAAREMVRSGQAYAYMSGKALKLVESVARKARLGVHRKPGTKPWDFRKR